MGMKTQYWMEVDGLPAVALLSITLYLDYFKATGGLTCINGSHGA